MDREGHRANSKIPERPLASEARVQRRRNEFKALLFTVAKLWGQHEC
jgi:hypothetical protein